MTARDTAEVQDRAMKWGAAAFLAKPIALQVLKAKIRSMEEKRYRHTGKQTMTNTFIAGRKCRNFPELFR